ncbi:hypothetical protein [Streptomyces sp. NBC_00147]|uniref:hypothetical protein n=1 Tax=Streptomyces sp. NBC_00147 TaxID=2975667 RepID=UPI0032496176
MKFVGTDHVFRLGSVRVEAFSGMTENLYKLIKEGAGRNTGAWPTTSVRPGAAPRKRTGWPNPSHFNQTAP